MAIVSCVECDEELEINGSPRLGQKVACPNCGASLEVASVNPLELDWAYEDEGWDEDDDFVDDEEDLLDDDDFIDNELEDDEDEDWK
jgi:alpha-aminoadipate/glutamate carrier protein LysW